MEPTIEQRLREVLAEFPAEEVQTIAAFAEFLRNRRQAGEPPVSVGAELSEEEHNRILQVLDAVAALSAETGPPVSNRDHDRYICTEESDGGLCGYWRVVCLLCAPCPYFAS